MSLVTTVIITAATLLLAASVFTALYRVIRGPSILDRMIGTDVILASIMCGLGAYMAVSGRTDLLPVLVVLAMLGFVGSVSVSRYVSKSDSMTPGAEAGALSDFSSSDWHMPKSETEAAEDAEATWAEDVARGISNVPDGPVEITVRDEVIVPDTGPAEKTTGAAGTADDAGEGTGSGPDAGPTEGLESERGATGSSRGTADAAAAAEYGTEDPGKGDRDDR